MKNSVEMTRAGIPSPKRIQNIRRAYNRVTFTHVAFGRKGIGDKPQLVLKGYTGIGVEVVYYSATGHGSEPAIYWKIDGNGKYYVLGKANQKDAVSIMNKMINPKMKQAIHQEYAKQRMTRPLFKKIKDN